MTAPDSTPDAGPVATVSAVRLAGDPSGRFRLGVIAKRTWTVAYGQCALAPLQVPIVEEPLYDEGRAVLVHDADVLLNRTRVDVVVDGHAYPPGGRTPFDVSVQVGGFVREARAFGPRSVAPDAFGRPLFSEPEYVERIPLAWESAYGGVDFAARADIGDPFEKAKADAGAPADPRFGLFAYPRNPAGRGYVIEPTRAAFEACALPLLEDPAALLTPATLARGDFVHWPYGPPVAGFGWLSYACFPRSAMLGVPPLVYDGARIPPFAFYEVQSGELPDVSVRSDRPIAERLSLGVAQSAAVGMRAPAVGPGDVVSLRGLHPREPRWTFRIPAEVPRMAARFAGGEVVEPLPQIRTVFVQPDADRLTLVWVGEVTIPTRPGLNGIPQLEHAVFWGAG